RSISRASRSARRRRSCSSSASAQMRLSPWPRSRRWKWNSWFAKARLPWRVPDSGEALGVVRPGDGGSVLPLHLLDQAVKVQAPRSAAAIGKDRARQAFEGGGHIAHVLFRDRT